VTTTRQRKAEPDDQERGSQAVHRVLRILRCWTVDDTSLSLTEIAQRTGLTLPTAHRMIKALQRESLFVQDSVSGRYSLGPTVMDLARALLQRADQDELAITAIPHLERMRAITGETVGLHVPLGDMRLCVAELVSQQPIRTATGVGRTYPLPRGASGKILVAWSPERLEIVMSAVDGIPPDERDKWQTEIALVRKRRYATSTGEVIEGASALALPIIGPNNDVRAAINVTGPTNRWTRQAMLRQLPELVYEAESISEQLGHRRDQGPQPRAALGAS
jgi:IclR family transcriptional regulator, KDG regulon repressor